MHENENNVTRPRTRTRPTKRGRERERELKIWPRDHVGLENLTSLADAEVAIRQLVGPITACVADVDVWTKANRLRLNPQKT